MEMEVLKQEKDSLDIKINNITVAEILRVYLNKQGSEFVVWRREHPTKPALMKIQGKNVKKEISDAIVEIKKDLDRVLKGVKK